VIAAHSLFMFSWIPIYEEAARRIMEYEHRQPELIAELKEMRQRGLSVIPLSDTSGEL